MIPELGIHLIKPLCEFSTYKHGYFTYEGATFDFEETTEITLIDLPQEYGYGDQEIEVLVPRF